MPNNAIADKMNAQLTKAKTILDDVIAKVIAEKQKIPQQFAASRFEEEETATNTKLDKLGEPSSYYNTPKQGGDDASKLSALNAVDKQFAQCKRMLNEIATAMSTHRFNDTQVIFNKLNTAINDITKLSDENPVVKSIATEGIKQLTEVLSDVQGQLSEYNLSRYRADLLTKDITHIIELLPVIKASLEEGHKPDAAKHKKALADLATVQAVSAILQAAARPGLDKFKALNDAYNALVDLRNYSQELANSIQNKNDPAVQALNQQLVIMEILEGAITTSLDVLADNENALAEVFPKERVTRISEAVAVVKNYAAALVDDNKTKYNAVVSEFEKLSAAVESGEITDKVDGKDQAYKLTPKDFAERMAKIYGEITALINDAKLAKTRLALQALLTDIELQYAEITGENAQLIKKVLQAPNDNNSSVVGGNTPAKPENFGERHAEYLANLAKHEALLKTHVHGGYTNEIDPANPARRNISLVTKDAAKSVADLKILGCKSVFYQSKSGSTDNYKKFLRACINHKLAYDSQHSKPPAYKTDEIQFLETILNFQDDHGKHLADPVAIMKKIQAHPDRSGLMQVFLKALAPDTVDEMTKILLSQYKQQAANNAPEKAETETLLTQLSVNFPAQGIVDLVRRAVNAKPAQNNLAALTALNKEAKTQGIAVVALFQKMPIDDKQEFLRLLGHIDKPYYLAAALYVHAELTEPQKLKLLTRFSGENREKFGLAVCLQYTQGVRDAAAVENAAAGIKEFLIDTASFFSDDEQNNIKSAVYAQLPKVDPPDANAMRKQFLDDLALTNDDATNLLIKAFNRTSDAKSKQLIANFSDAEQAMAKYLLVNPSAITDAKRTVFWQAVSAKDTLVPIAKTLLGKRPSQTQIYSPAQAESFVNFYKQLPESSKVQLGQFLLLNPTTKCSEYELAALFGALLIMNPPCHEVVEALLKELASNAVMCQKTISVVLRFCRPQVDHFVAYLQGKGKVEAAASKPTAGPRPSWAHKQCDVLSVVEKCIGVYNTNNPGPPAVKAC